MAKLDLFSDLSVPVKSLDVAAKTSSANGASADLKDYHACIAIIDADARTDGTHTIHLEESDDNSTFTDVAAADLVFDEAGAVNSSGQVVIDGAADDDQAFVLSYVGSKRYVRVATTVASATTGAIYGALLIPCKKRDKGKLNT